MARLTLARKIAAIALTLWKKGENFDAEKLKSKMKLLRWNDARLHRPQGKRAVPRASHSGQWLEVKKRFALPVEGEVFSVTFPFIDQAISVIGVSK
jgi:hypothetical protein